MRRKSGWAQCSIFVFIVVFMFAAAMSAFGQTQDMSSAYGSLPLGVEPNQGQSHQDIKFLARGIGLGVFVTDSEAVMVLNRAPAKNSEASRAVLRMSFAGSEHLAARAVDQLPGESNYIIGPDRARWRTNIPTFAKLRFEDVYPGVDAELHGDHRQLEYDFIIAPGADPTPIAVRFQGVDAISTTATGDLALLVAGGRIIERKPYAYQQLGKIRRHVAANYVLLSKDKVGF